MNNPLFIVGQKGQFSLVTPFAKLQSPNVEYTITEISTFQGKAHSGFDILEGVYKPNSLGIEEYNADLAIGANLITLSSAGRPDILVPSTYISKQPNLNVVPYYEGLFVAEIGMVPADLQLDNLRTKIAALISDVTGVDLGSVGVKLVGLPMDGYVTVEEHQRLEEVRKNNIKDRTTDRALYLASQSKIEALEKEVRDLSTIIVESGIALPSNPTKKK